MTGKFVVRIRMDEQFKQDFKHGMKGRHRR